MIQTKILSSDICYVRQMWEELTLRVLPVEGRIDSHQTLYSIYLGMNLEEKKLHLTSQVLKDYVSNEGYVYNYVEDPNNL